MQAGLDRLAIGLAEHELDRLLVGLHAEEAGDQPDHDARPAQSARCPCTSRSRPASGCCSRSWPLRMTSSISGGRREPNGPPPPPRFRRRRPRAAATAAAAAAAAPGAAAVVVPRHPSPRGRWRRCGACAFDFTSRCIYVTAAIPSIKRRHNIAGAAETSDMAEITESAVRERSRNRHRPGDRQERRGAGHGERRRHPRRTCCSHPGG